MYIAVVSRGTVIHTGQVSAPSVGASGAPIGIVSVRIGDVVEMPNRTRIANLMALEYSGTLSSQTKWLQFVWFEMIASRLGGTIRSRGTIPTSSGILPFTTNPSLPNWAVDSGPTNPFYESEALAIRSLSSTTIFDRPGGSSVVPLAQGVFRTGLGTTSATFTAHFKTYLIQRNVAVYQVPWSASTTITMSRGGAVAAPVTYTVRQAGAITGLPANLKGILHLNYSAYRHVR